MNKLQPIREWIINAIAGHKNETALVIYGPEKSGKTLACKIFADNFNENEIYFLDNYERKVYLNRFNAFLERKKIIFCEELQETGPILPLITSLDLKINKMMEYPKIIRNELNVVCTITGEPNFIDLKAPFLLVEPLAFIHILRGVTQRGCIAHIPNRLLICQEKCCITYS